MAARLGRVCRAARTAARPRLRMVDVAQCAGVSESTIHNFEHGRYWARNTDEIVAAYAQLCETPERALWQAAIDLPGD